MPSRLPQHRPAGHGAAARAHAQRDRERQALRPNAADRGYDAQWQQLRAAHLANHPSCVVEGCNLPATDVDHIADIRHHPERRLDPANLRSMCHAHHAQRTARDQGFARSGSTEEAPLRGARHPAWLRKVVVPLTVVCGPPASGKSHYVEHRAGPRDMVLDLGVILSQLSRFPLYSVPSSFDDQGLRWRNSRLALLDHIHHRWPAAWLIVNEPRPQWRQWWIEHVGALRVVVMETEPAVCFDRIAADERRPAKVHERQRDGVVSWWSRYTRRDGDMIIRPNARPFIVHGAAHGTAAE